MPQRKEEQNDACGSSWRLSFSSVGTTGCIKCFSTISFTVVDMFLYCLILHTVLFEQLLGRNGWWRR